MKNKILLYQFACLLLIIVVTVLMVQTNKKPANRMEKNETSQVSEKDAVLSVIHNRKSVRSYIPQKSVEQEELLTLVKAGMAAPTAVNQQVWAFVTVTERTTLDSLASILPYAKMLNDAGAAILVCAEMEEVKLEAAREFWVQDCSAATENILLAAEAMGLGAVWTGIYPYTFLGEETVNKIRAMLDIPDSVHILNAIAVGHPTGKDIPKDKFNETKLHMEKW